MKSMKTRWFAALCLGVGGLGALSCGQPDETAPAAVTAVKAGSPGLIDRAGAAEPWHQKAIGTTGTCQEVRFVGGRAVCQDLWIRTGRDPLVRHSGPPGSGQPQRDGCYSCHSADPAP